MAFFAALAAAALLPGFTPIATGPNGGQVLSGPIPGTQQAGWVYLPPGFRATSHYRTVYLLHGMPGSPSEFVDGANLLGWADPRIAAGSIPPFIAVMPAAGPSPRYNGEWAGRWARAIVGGVLPWADAHLPTIRSGGARTIAGISAGGFGAADIALRHPGLFGTVESWSGYFDPLHDGPFKTASRATLAANDPTVLARMEAPTLRADGTRFFLSTGPYHSHWFRPAQTVGFARELAGLGVRERLVRLTRAKGEYRTQLAAGLGWALAG